MKISPKGLALIKASEGLVLYAYDDADSKRVKTFVREGMPVYGTLTIGYGHTKSVRKGQTISKEEAERLLQSDVEWAEAGVRTKVSAPLKQHEFDALVSLVYNIGLANFAKSNVLRHLNAQHYEQAADSFLAWHRGNGVANRLLGRRKAERAVFLGQA